MIALFCHGGFVRYYLGDVIVVWAVYCFVQIFLRGRFSSYGVALGVMIFAFIIEFLQGVNIVDLIGLGDIPFFRVLIGTSFSPSICFATRWELPQSSQEYSSTGNTDKPDNIVFPEESI